MKEAVSLVDYSSGLPRLIYCFQQWWTFRQLFSSLCTRTPVTFVCVRFHNVYTLMPLLMPGIKCFYMTVGFSRETLEWPKCLTRKCWLVVTSRESWKGKRATEKADYEWYYHRRQILRVQFSLVRSKGITRSNGSSIKQWNVLLDDEVKIKLTIFGSFQWKKVWLCVNFLPLPWWNIIWQRNYGNLLLNFPIIFPHPSL